ncbi:MULTISPECIES: hypothetical protein [Stenotrophomonas]|uniref:hypothetical protein n=1 Tax=Stenotrophomonas TaxID=40323 RepID=UPI0011B1D2CB|nr:MULTISPECIES: hypothetical protein [Stenotrophomonas]
MELPLHVQDAQIALARGEDALFQKMLIEAAVSAAGVFLQHQAERNGMRAGWDGHGHRQAPWQNRAHRRVEVSQPVHMGCTPARQGVT